MHLESGVRIGGHHQVYLVFSNECSGVAEPSHPIITNQLQLDALSHTNANWDSRGGEGCGLTMPTTT